MINININIEKEKKLNSQILINGFIANNTIKSNQSKDSFHLNV